MALAISSVYNGYSNNPGANISVSGLTGFDTYKITRVSVGSVFADAPVRGADRINVVSNTALVNDYEMPINFDFNWRVDGYNSSGVITGTATTSTPFQVVSTTFPSYYGNFWIKNIDNPTFSTAVVVSDFSEVEFDPVILGKYNVLGRKNPVVFTDVWGAKSGQFSLLSADLLGNQTSIATLEALLQSGDVLLFQTAYQSDILRDMYFIVTALNRTQYTAPGLNNTLEFTYQVGFQEVDRPITAGLTVGYGVWLDLETDAAFLNYNDVAAAVPTYADLLSRYSV